MSNWREQAECLNNHDPEMWFPNPGESESARLAKQICLGCPVITQCDTEAERLKINEGIWAGKRRTGHKPPMSDFRQPCGTTAAYRRHRRNYETPCRACLEANRRATADRVQARYQKSVERRANR